MLLGDRKRWWIERIRQTEMYTKDRNFAGTDEKVTNQANWRIARWWIRQFYCIYVVQLNCHGIISFMFAMVPFHLLLLILGYIACFFANLIISTFWHFFHVGFYGFSTIVQVHLYLLFLSRLISYFGNCVYIYSYFHWQLLSLLRNGSQYHFCLISESYELINQSIFSSLLFWLTW